MEQNLLSQLSSEERWYYTPPVEGRPQMIVRHSAINENIVPKTKRSRVKRTDTKLILLKAERAAYKIESAKKKAQLVQQLTDDKVSREQRRENKAIQEQQEKLQRKKDRTASALATKEKLANKKIRTAEKARIAEELVSIQNKLTGTSVGQLNSKGLIPVRVDDKTILEIKPGKDIQAVVDAYRKRESIKRLDFFNSCS